MPLLINGHGNSENVFNVKNKEKKMKKLDMGISTQKNFFITETPDSLSPVENLWKWLNNYGYINSKKMLTFVENDLNIKRELMHKIIIKSTYYLQRAYSINQRMRFLRYNLDEKTFGCPACGAPRFFDASTSKFRNICQKTDQLHHDINIKIMKTRFEKTCLIKYGEKNPMSVKSIKDKSKKTNLIKYGVENPMQNPNIRKRFNKTMIDRYGVDEPSKSKLICSKRNDTFKEKYGVENFGYIFKLEEMQAKRLNTFQQKYGVSHPMKSNQIKEKLKKTCLQKYGVENVMQNPKILKDYQIKSFEKYGEKMAFNSKEGVQKRKKTCLERFGVDNPFKSKKINQKATKLKYNKYGITIGNKTRLFYSKNIDKLTKTILQNNFLDENNYLLISKMKKFYSISTTTCYNYMRAFNIDFKYKEGGFHPDKPAILYYIYDPQEDLYKIGITNLTVEERFGKTFCSNRAIAILEQKTFEKGKDAYIEEQEILEQFAYVRCINNSWPQEKGGRTEFFNRDILNLDKFK